jgi:hypothetical protein
MTVWTLLAQPAPEPTPVQQPPPTVVVEPQLTFPPELLERLAPVEASGLTQPWATLLAGLFVLVAAFFAFGGVLYAQRVTRATTKAQLRQQRAAMIRQEKQLNEQLRVQQKLHDDAQERLAKQHAAALKGQLDLLRLQTHAESQKQARQDVKDAVMEAQARLQEAYNSAVAVLGTRIVGNSLSTELTKQWAVATTACQASAKTLSILGLDDAREALERAMAEFGRSIVASSSDHREEWDKLQTHYGAATSAFKLALIVAP